MRYLWGYLLVYNSLPNAHVKLHVTRIFGGLAALVTRDVTAPSLTGSGRSVVGGAGRMVCAENLDTDVNIRNYMLEK